MKLSKENEIFKMEIENREKGKKSKYYEILSRRLIRIFAGPSKKFNF